MYIHIIFFTINTHLYQIRISKYQPFHEFFLLWQIKSLELKKPLPLNYQFITKQIYCSYNGKHVSEVFYYQKKYI